jgi:peptidoglycan/LPS O-acetylase OafA/YrhL
VEENREHHRWKESMERGAGGDASGTARGAGYRRVHEIDGIRGWAALSVLLFHFVYTCLGTRMPLFHSPFFRATMDGPFAVLVFFVLSGDALSTAFLASDLRGRLRMVVGRWPRLVFPVFVSCLVVFVLVRAGAVFSRQAGVALGLEDWLGSFLTFHAEVPGLLRYGLVHVFRTSDPEGSYNPILWSMAVEFKGSFLVFGYLLATARLNLPGHLALLGVAAALLVWKGSYLCLFPVGIVFALCRREGWLDKGRFSWIGIALGWLLPVAVGLWIAFSGLPPNTFRGVVAAPLFLLGVHLNPQLLAFFRSWFSRFLGWISFPLYVLQFPVLVSLSSWLFWKTAAAGRLGPGTGLAMALVSCLATGVVSVPLALLDDLYQRGLRRSLGASSRA